MFDFSSSAKRRRSASMNRARFFLAVLDQLNRGTVRDEFALRRTEGRLDHQLLAR
jgi:hypothetical protein